MRIYIAGALSQSGNTSRTPTKIVTDYVQNLNEVLKAALEVLGLGHAPYVPGLDFLLGLVSGYLVEEDYRFINEEFMKVCDAVFVVSWSKGVEHEVQIARELGLRVYYTIEEIPPNELSDSKS